MLLAFFRKQNQYLRKKDTPAAQAAGVFVWGKSTAHVPSLQRDHEHRREHNSRK
jgi:hypothetical protein